MPDINSKIVGRVEDRDNLDLTIIGLTLAGGLPCKKMASLIRVGADLNDKITLASQLA